MAPNSRYSNYDDFAWVYNKRFGNDFRPRALMALDSFALSHIPRNARILDVCCGTGQLAQSLTERGYQVTGIDGSENMLQFAKENAPKAKFILADARSFSCSDTYHLVVSMYDSLNHIMNSTDLTSVFQNVFSVLIDSGLFIFDLNMEEAYKTGWNTSYSILEHDYACIIRQGYSPEEHIGRFEETIFRKQQHWQRSDITILERCYSEEEVVSSLRNAGFANIVAYAHDKQSGFEELTDKARRAFFVCRKG